MGIKENKGNQKEHRKGELSVALGSKEGFPEELFLICNIEVE